MFEETKTVSDIFSLNPNQVFVFFCLNLARPKIENGETKASVCFAEMYITNIYSGDSVPVYFFSLLVSVVSPF